MRKLAIWILLMITTGIVSSQSLIDRQFEIKTIDSLEQKLNEHHGSEDRLVLLNMLAEAYWFHNPDMTLRYADEALSLSRELGQKRAEGYALINMCQGYLLKDIYDKALRYGLMSLQVRENLEDIEDIAFTLRTLGWLYYDIEDSDLAREYHEKVLEINLQLNDPGKIAYSYNSLGLVFAQKGDHEEAIQYFLQSLQIKNQFGKSQRISETLKNIGISYSALEEYDLAQEYLLNSSEIFNQANDKYRQAQVYNELAHVYTQLGEYAKAQNMLSEIDRMVDLLSDNQELKMKYYLVSSELHRKLGNYAVALADHQKYTRIHNRVLSSDQNHKLAHMRVTYESEKRENEIKILSQEKELADLKRKGFMAGAFLLLVIAILVVTRMRSNFKKRRMIYEANQALAAEKIRNEKLVRDNLKNELQFKSQELVNFGLHISQKNELYIGFIKQLQELEFMNKYDASDKIRGLIQYFNQQLKFNETLDEYETDAQTINDDFFFRLHEKFPHLTDHDRRLVAQLRRKLSSKDISVLNNISVKSVEISRYRLRKKLHLEKDQNLVEFIQNI